jgi:2-amino-4-hydroxy-6-hydroxymethyldihydropteridine diphosphokinase
MEGGVFIGLGSNLGEKEENLLYAIREIQRDDRVEMVRISSLYLTSPVSDIEQEDFLNCVISIEFDGSPFDLLRVLKGIESSMGRKGFVRWGPRVIDIDILLFKESIIRHEELFVPHARLHERRFAIIPCLEIDKDLVHPVFKRPLSSFLGEIESTQRVELIKSIDPGLVKRSPCAF